MEQTFYVNVLFGRNKNRIFNKILDIVAQKQAFRLQIHPFRINSLAEISNISMGGSLKNIRLNIEQHLDIMADVKASHMIDTNGTTRKPFTNVIFVNYTTKELEPALKTERIHYYLCDYIDETNIEILTLRAPIYINFMNRLNTHSLSSINKYFMTYSILSFYDTNADQRIANVTTLDLGEETEDDVAFLLQTRLTLDNESDENNSWYKSDNDNASTTAGVNATKNTVVLPYHPFRSSLFITTQMTKDNINAILLSPHSHLLYFPFEQSEWLIILRNIMYEHVILNFLIDNSLYAHERIHVHDQLFRNSVSMDFRRFKRIQRKHKTHVLNEIVFDYNNGFLNNSFIYGRWYNRETKIINSTQSPQFATDISCLSTTNGLFI